MSSRQQKAAARSRRGQQRQQKEAQGQQLRQGRSKDDFSSRTSSSSSAWDTGSGLAAPKPVTPGRGGEPAAHRPVSAAGKSRRARERAEDNAGSALKAQRKLDAVIGKLNAANADDHPSEINLESCRIGDRGLVNLSHELRGNTSVQRMRLGGCDITYAGFRSLRDVFRGPGQGQSLVNTIRRIELCTRKMPKVGNPLGNHGAECLAEVIRSSSTLRHVNASCCSIGDEGATSLAEALSSSPPLLTLELDQNVIGNSGAFTLGQALARNSTLEGLSLWKNRIGPRGVHGIAEGLATNRSLRWLGLGCNKMCDDGAKHLARVLCVSRGQSMLSWLAVGGNSITDDGAVHLARALQGKSAEDLEVSGDEDEDEMSSIDDATPTEFPALKSLGLGGNDISDEAAEAFGAMLLENDVLLSLGMGDCNIGDDGARHLAVGVQGNDSLQRLVLSGNCISDDGAGYLSGALSQNNTLQCLFLAENPITDEGGRRFQEVLCGNFNATLTTLDLHETDMTNVGFMELCNTLRKNSNLHQLGTHLSVLDLTSTSSASLTASDAGGLDHADGAVVSARPASVVKVEAGNALLGQEMLKPPAGSFRHPAGAPGGGGLFRARGSATAAAIQAIPNVSDELTSAQVALEGFRTFVTDEQAAAALQDGKAEDGKPQAVANAANRFLNLRLLARRSYIFSDKTPITSPTATEGKKKRWSLFGSKRKFSSELSGSQAELISLAESLDDGNKVEYSMSNQLSQSSLPPPPAMASGLLMDCEGIEGESSFMDSALPPPPPPIPPRRHSLTPREPTIPETIDELDGHQSVHVRQRTGKKTEKKSKRQSVTVDPSRALAGNWRQGYTSSFRGSTKRQLDEVEDDEAGGFEGESNPEEISDDPALAAWASQAPDEDSDADVPMSLPPLAAAKKEEEHKPSPEQPVKSDPPSADERDGKNNQQKTRLPAPKSALPLVARLGSARRSKKKQNVQAPEVEEVSVRSVLKASEEAANGRGRQKKASQDSILSNKSEDVNPYHTVDLPPSPMTERQLDYTPVDSTEEDRFETVAQSLSPGNEPYHSRHRADVMHAQLAAGAASSDSQHFTEHATCLRSETDAAYLDAESDEDDDVPLVPPASNTTPVQKSRPNSIKVAASKRDASPQADHIMAVGLGISRSEPTPPALKTTERPPSAVTANLASSDKRRSQRSKHGDQTGHGSKSPAKKETQQPERSTGRGVSTAADKKAVQSKLNAVLAQGLPQQSPSARKTPPPPPPRADVEEVFENDDLGPLADDTDLAIQHIRRSASMDLSHPTKSRSRPPSRRLPSRETSLSSLRQDSASSSLLSEPTSPTSLGSDEMASLLHPHKSQPPTTPPQQDENLVERLTQLQDGEALLQEYSRISSAVDEMTYRHDNASEPRNGGTLRPNATLAPDQSLVRLLGVTGKSQFTFINASYVGNMLDSRLCIATQAPMAETLPEFWRMVWEHNVRTIVAIAAESDGYTVSYSSATEQDFDLVEPSSAQATGGSVVRSALKVISTPSRVETVANVTSREFVLENSQTMETRTVTAYLYNAWSFEGVLGSVSDLAQLTELISGRRNSGEPILVHCKDGGVRTGCTVASILAAHVLLSAKNRRSRVHIHESDYSLDQMWLDTAQQRPGFAFDQTAYRLYHQIVLGCVFGANAVKNTDVAGSRHVSKTSLLKQKGKKTKKSGRSSSRK